MPPLSFVELLGHLPLFLVPVATVVYSDPCNNNTKNWTLKINKNDKQYSFNKTNRYLFFLLTRDHGTLVVF